LIYRKVGAASELDTASIVIATIGAEKTMGKQEISTGPKSAKTPSPSPFDTLRTEIDRVFDDVTRGWPSLGTLWPTRRTALSAFKNVDLLPQVDTSEDDTAYEIAVELPGVAEKDVSLAIDNGMLTLRGEKKSEREEKNKEYHLTERSYGTFERSFRIPENVDEAKIGASVDNGVLKIVLPKSAKSKPSERRIPIGSKAK
jgi:HSP20 family protein